MKKYKFLFFTLLLAFLFIPKDVFAAQIDSNKIQINTQELFWDGTNAQGGYESGRFNSTQNHLYQWGSASASYKLYRFAPLINFTSLGVDTSYKARVAFYVFVDQPYSYDDKYCTLFSGNGEKYSCSLYREMDDQTGSSSSLLTFVYDFEWTSSSGYVEFWLNFENFYGVPDKTEFMYTILDFQGNVSGNQIILDGLGQTNKKLDEINDVIKDSFTNCSLKKEELFYPDDVSIKDNYLDVNGNLVPDSGSGITDYISVVPDTTYNIVPTSNVLNLGSFCLYNSSKKLISCEQFRKRVNINFNTKKAKFIRISITGSNAKPLTLSHNACVNRIDETNEKLDKLEQSITSEDGPNLDGLDNSAGWLPAGPVDSILNLPFSFFENLTDNLSKTCQPVALTFPFTNTNFQLPCISTLYEKIGIMDFLNWLGVVVAAIILYRYFLSLYKWVDDTLTFRENNHNDWGGV